MFQHYCVEILIAVILVLAKKTGNLTFVRGMEASKLINDVGEAWKNMEDIEGLVQV